MTGRATSTTLSYVLTLSIATLLVGGLVFAGSTFVEDHRKQVIRQELQVIGEHLASNLEQVDRYAAAADDVDAARIGQTFPDSVTGSTYTVKLREDGSQPRLYLNASRPRVRVTVAVSVTGASVSESVASGGRMAANCEPSGGSCSLEVDDA